MHRVWGVIAGLCGYWIVAAHKHCLYFLEQEHHAEEKGWNVIECDESLHYVKIEFWQNLHWLNIDDDDDV